MGGDKNLMDTYSYSAGLQFSKNRLPAASKLSSESFVPLIKMRGKWYEVESVMWTKHFAYTLTDL